MGKFIIIRNYFKILGVDESKIVIKESLQNPAPLLEILKTAHAESLELINNDKQTLTKKQKTDLITLMNNAYNEVNIESKLKTYLEKHYPTQSTNTKDITRFAYLDACTFSKAGTRLIEVYNATLPELEPQHPKPGLVNKTKKSAPAVVKKVEVVTVPVVETQVSIAEQTQNMVEVSAAAPLPPATAPTVTQEVVAIVTPDAPQVAQHPVPERTIEITDTNPKQPVAVTTTTPVALSVPVAGPGPTKIDSFITMLNTYAEERKPKDEYLYTFFCINLGYSKSQKLQAVKQLTKSLNSETPDVPIIAFEGALSNGNLGRKINEFLRDNKDLFPGKTVNNVRELLLHLSPGAHALGLN